MTQERVELDAAGLLKLRQTHENGFRLAKSKTGRDKAKASLRVLDEIDAELVIAARIVAFEDQSPETLKRLDKATEAFADRVQWDDTPIEDAAFPLTAQPSERGVVTVKPLDWTRVDDDEWWGATALGLSWEVRQARAAVRVRTHDNRQFEVFDGTVEEAKAAAQADFERRILSALRPSISDSGMVEALRSLRTEIEKCHGNWPKVDRSDLRFFTLLIDAALSRQEPAPAGVVAWTSRDQLHFAKSGFGRMACNKGEWIEPVALYVLPAAPVQER